MTDESVSGQPEGEVLPAFLKRAEQAIESIEQRAVAAIERWYAAHFHAAAQAGTAPLSADDKAALIQHVADAVASTPASKE